VGSLVASSIRKASKSAVAEAAKKLEPKLRKAFIEAMQSVKARVKISELERAILTGDEGVVRRALNLEEEITGALKGTHLAAATTTVVEVVEQTFRAGAKAAMEELPTTIATELSFDLLNPRAVEFLRDYEFDLVRDISGKQQNIIRGIMDRAFTEGMHPRKSAREIRRYIGLTEKQAAAVSRFQHNLASGDKGALREALSRGLRDRRFDSTLRRALDEDIILSPAQIEKMSQRYAERYLKFRSETIARTETKRASVRGQQELWQQAIDQGVLPPDVQRRWITNDPCAICAPLGGKLAGMNDAFPGGYMAPPDPHPNCTCDVVLDFKRERT
jgi:hypothetical protein